MIIFVFCLSIENIEGRRFKDSSQLLFRWFHSFPDIFSTLNTPLFLLSLLKLFSLLIEKSY